MLFKSRRCSLTFVYFFLAISGQWVLKSPTLSVDWFAPPFSDNFCSYVYLKLYFKDTRVQSCYVFLISWSFCLHKKSFPLVILFILRSVWLIWSHQLSYASILRFIALCIIMLCRYYVLHKLKVCGHPALSKSACHFSNVWCLCITLGVSVSHFGNFCSISNTLLLFLLMMISDYNSLKLRWWSALFSDKVFLSYLLF